MEKTVIKILYIEDNPADVEFVKNQLEKYSEFELECVDLLEPGMKRLAEWDPDLLLLDLNLPDAPGMLGTLEKVRDQFIDVPILVFTSIDDETMGIKAVKIGAQDYLIKGHINGWVLVNAIRNGIERHHNEAFYRMIVYSSSNPVLVLDWKKKIVYMNPISEETFQNKAEDWVGKTFPYEIDIDDPQDLDLGKKGKFQIHITETEFKDDVYNIIHLDRV